MIPESCPCSTITSFPIRLLLFSLLTFTGTAQASAAHQNPSEDRLQEAIQLISQGNYPSAQQLLEGMVNSSAAPPVNAYFQLAVCYAKQRQWEKAEIMLRTFQRHDPETLPALHLQGYIAFNTGRYDEALQLINTYLGEKPDSGEAYKIRGLSLFMLGKPREAQKELQRSVQLAPDDPEAHYYLGRIYFTNDNLLGALEEFKKTVQLDPASVKGFNQLGQTYEGLSQYSAARDAYLKAIELEKQQPVKSEWPYFNLGVLQLKEGNAADAIAYLKAALDRNRRWADGKIKLALALSAAAKGDEALTLLEEAVQLEPQNAEAHYQMALLLSKLGRSEEARSAFLRFEQLKSTKTDP